MSIKSLFGAKLKFYRKKKQLSQEQLSEKVGISVKHLSAIERGLTFVSSDLIEKLSYSLETPAFLFFIKEHEIFHNNATLETIDRIVEKHLLKTIETIKAGIREDCGGL